MPLIRQNSPNFCLFSSNTVVPKRVPVTFIAKVKGVVLKDFLGGLAPKTTPSSHKDLQLGATATFISSINFHFITPSNSIPPSYHFGKQKGNPYIPRKL